MLRVSDYCYSIKKTKNKNKNKKQQQKKNMKYGVGVCRIFKKENNN